MPSVPLALSSGAASTLELALPAILGGLYTWRARTLASGGQRVPAWRQLCFYAGLVVVSVTLAALVSPGQQLVYVHVIEQLALGDIAPLLIVLGLSGPLLAPLLPAELGAVRLFDRLRALSHPMIAFPLWSIDLFAWHLPVLCHAALRHTGIQALEHACLLGLGINMWMCLFGPLPTPSWFGNLARLSYILAVRLAAAGLANVLLWSGTIFYPFYLHGEALHHLSPVADQNIAGAIMMVEETILTLGLFGWLFRRIARENREHQDLLEFARSRGLVLSESRAGRAVAAGRAAELRRRLEARISAPDEQT
jgi:cytochrome c oxidase assembly factor CtaG